MVPVLLAACLLGVSVGKTDPEWLGGEGPPFAFSAGGNGARRPGDTLTVVMAVGGRYWDDPAVAFHVTIPRSLRVLSGDTTRAGRLSTTAGNYTLKLLPRLTGSFVVEGRLRIEGGGRRDDAAFAMSIAVRPDTIIVDHSHYTLLESTRNGHRYRYGDWWLIPIDSTEASIVEQDFEASGTRAQPVARPNAVCRTCPSIVGADSVRFVVIVGSDGRVRDWGLLPSPSNPGAVHAAVAAAAEEALKRCTFTPARFNGRAVSDWLYVTVSVTKD